jgi:hypothetical protein
MDTAVGIVLAVCLLLLLLPALQREHTRRTTFEDQRSDL